MTEQEFLVKQVVDEMLLPVLARIVTLEERLDIIESSIKVSVDDKNVKVSELEDIYTFNGAD